MTESGIDDTKFEWKLKKEREAICIEMNQLSPLTVTLDQQGRIVSFNQACEQTTGYSFNEVKGKLVWDLFLIPEEVELFKALYCQLKAGSASECKYESYWVTKNKTHRRIAWSSTVLANNEGEVEYIISTGIDLQQQTHLLKEFEQHNQHNQLLAEITLKIRQSLQLEEILQTTVTQVRHLLQADRVLIYRLWPDGTGSAVNEAVGSGWPAVLGMSFPSEVFPHKYKQLYTCGRVRNIGDVENTDISPCLVEFLQQFGVKAKLVLPILLKQELWGLLVVHQCSSPRQWSGCEIELLQQLADQVGIALAQAQLLGALRESEERYAIAYQGTNDGLWDWNLNFNKIYFSPRWKTMLGYQETEIGNSIDEWFNRVHPNDIPPLQAALAAHCSGLTPQFNSEHRVLHKDGTYRWMLYRGQAVRDTNGNAHRLAGSQTDITERKQAQEELSKHRENLEELVAERTAKLTTALEQLQQEIAKRQLTEQALRSSEERWRSLVKNAPDLIFTCDREGTLLFINRTLSGLTLEQVFGTSVYNYILPQHHETVQQSLERVVQTGESVYYEVEGGTTQDNITWYATRVGPIRRDGQVVAVIGICTDITQRKQAEELLHQREQEFRALVENSPDLVVRFDKQLRHVYVNPAVERATGIPKHVFIGKTNQDLGMPQDLVDRWHEALLNVLETGTEQGLEFSFPTPNGTKSYQSRIVPEVTQDGTIKYVLGVTHNITERKQAEEALLKWALREQAINHVVQAIRNSLDLETIFSTTVEEMARLLHVERVVIVQYIPERQLWLHVADHTTSPELPNTVGFEIPDQGNSIAARLKQKEVVKIDKTNRCDDEINQAVAQTFPGSWLLVPLHFNDQVWGSLSLLAENRSYPWQDSEVELGLAVATQLAIAIQQAQLWHQSCTATVKAQEQATKLANEIAERKRTEDTLRSLYKISTARKLSFKQRLQGLLALGRRRFGLEMGALSQVENNTYEIVSAQSPPKSPLQMTTGSMWDLAQRYCHETLSAKEPIAFESAGTSRWYNHPAYASSGIEAYIGMPVVVADRVYGTLSFFSLQIRLQPFTAGDKELLKLMAQWVGAFLERQQTEEELRQSEARFRELAQKEALLNQLANQIRRSLDLNTILETAVYEIRNLLQIDRCFFLWYRPDALPPSWEVVTEAKSPTFPSLIGYSVPVTTFGPLTTRVFNKEITRVDSARELTDPVERKFFFTIGYTALLALPIHTTYGEVGVVSCGHSSGPRPWRDSEVELLQAVADQLAIAIDQAQLLHQSHTATEKAQQQATQLEQVCRNLRETQTHLVQSEKMSSLGQMVAGVAHEINNPISFIYGNLIHVNQYAKDLLELIQLYQESYPQPAETIQALVEEIDLNFIKEDLPKILSSMQMGTDRISQIVSSLRNFSRLDEAEMKWVDIHEGIDSTLLILAHRLKAKDPNAPGIQIIKDYGDLPLVQCYPGQLNQVFMNILSNAIDAIEESYKNRSPDQIKNHPSTIWICTEVLMSSNQAIVLIGDNGPGMKQEVCNRLFDPFFTTKPVGQGTGLGMSISYQIVVEKHGGQLQCISAPGQGTAFLIYIPVQQSAA